MLRAIAIDDEPMALAVIKSLVAEVGFVVITECFSNPLKAMGYLQKNKVDLLFLDIKMPTISGIDLLKALPNPPMVIFTTAYSEHAVQSFELDAVDYLLKPFAPERLLRACNKAKELYELRKNGEGLPAATGAIFIKSGYEQVRVNLDEILYVEGVGNYVQFVMGKQNILSRLSVSEAENLLPGSGFVRIHRSFIVGKKWISRIEKRAIWIGQKEIPIGEAYLQSIRRIIENN
jgi:DNA-binding LytR/AlgR family response regulator